MSIKDKIQDVENKFTKDTKKPPTSPKEVDLLRTKYLGRKGFVSTLFSEVISLSSNERPIAGKLLNKLKLQISQKVEDYSENIAIEKSSKENIDFTLPGDPVQIGSRHPLTLVLEDIKSIFTKLGYSIAYGREVETEYYNFEALNIPKYHPARDMQDTFYIEPGVVLRTHTSNTQIHTMLNQLPPIKIIAPGRVYRNEDISVRSYCLFHQVEGLFIDKKVTFGDLKGVLDYFAKEFFGQKVKTRFRPSYFPFTEPSAEMDVSCIFCNGNGCNICKNAGWLEILGCGMVDTEVFKAVNIDNEIWSGFAFGMGIERMTMLRYGVEDIRTLYEGDIRFLRQFS